MITALRIAPLVFVAAIMQVTVLGGARVLVHPGYFFDFQREAFLVVSLLPPPAIFADAVARMLRLAAN